MSLYEKIQRAIKTHGFKNISLAIGDEAILVKSEKGQVWIGLEDTRKEITNKLMKIGAK